MAILTPDRRLRVFVSSTLVEVAEERDAVARAIAALRLTAVMFELGARPHPPRELYRAYLAQSDIVIGIYWQRYGWVGPDMDISGLEDEFRLSLGMPRLLYVKEPAPDREERLTALIGELQAEGTESYRTFRTPRELGRLVRDDLATLLSERFTDGSAGRVEPAADRRPSRSLPVTSTSLIGREHDITAIARLLGTSDVRLVTLTGPGGIGKTRLAIAVGERLDAAYAQGTIFVPLASEADPAAVLPRIAAAVRATVEGSRSPLDAVVERLGETPTLLVLDNLEQVVTVAPEIDELLTRCPGLRILATSRSVLRLRAEREYGVSPLAVPAYVDAPPIDEVASLPAVQLFVDRARAVRHAFALTHDNAAAIVEICRRLDGLPLAIELAAARTRLLDPSALLLRLGGRLDALGTGPVDLPERQRTLRATIDWSVGLLDDDERRMLATLSVFADGWTIEAATEVSDLPEDRALDLLDALAGHSLVQVDAADDGPRFRMLESVRELAAERLAATGDDAEVARRHAKFFGDFVARSDWPTERQVAWVDRIGVEEENVRVAVRWLLAHDVAPLPHLFRVLWLFWQMRGRMPEGRSWIQQLESRADELDDRGRSELLFVSAVTAVEVGDDDSALAALDGLRRVEGRIDDPYLENAARLAISWILPLVDDMDGAVDAASAALDGFRQRDEPFVAFAALTVGMVETLLGRRQAARDHFVEVDRLGRQYGNTWLEATARGQLATIAVADGRLEDARALLVGSVEAGADALSTLSISFSLVALARLKAAAGDARGAALALGAADGLRRRAGLRAWPSQRQGETALTTLVRELLDAGEFDDRFAAGSSMTHREAVALVRSS